VVVPAVLGGATVAASPAARASGAGVTFSEDIVELGGSGVGAFSTRVSRSEQPAKSVPTANVATAMFSFRFIIVVSISGYKGLHQEVTVQPAPVAYHGV
jgi:hypothetical protein